MNIVIKFVSRRASDYQIDESEYNTIIRCFQQKSPYLIFTTIDGQTHIIYEDKIEEISYMEPYVES